MSDAAPLKTPRRAVVLLSGGLDSATVLAVARSQGFECRTLAVHYGQRHSAELEAAQRISATLGAVEHRQMRVDLAGIGGSALTDPALAIPTTASMQVDAGIPVTYVPARNTLLLALALGWAEVLDAEAVFIGVNSVDYSGYPDCRPQFIAAFDALAALATRAGVEGRAAHIHAPLQYLGKNQIIQLGLSLGVDYSHTVSCYQADADGRACGDCDACRLRREGFVAAGLPDPTRYV
jgi:7-cyano-7-deazaguanine synthase